MQNSRQMTHYYGLLDTVVSLLEYLIVIILFSGLGFALAVKMAGM